MRRELFICLLLVGVTLAIYWPARHYGTVDYDDPLVLTDNPELKNGLTWHSLRWALSSVVIANWHPVTNLSFLLDSQLFGINPGAEHLVNVIFHAANAVLLFLVLNRLMGLRSNKNNGATTPQADLPSNKDVGAPAPAQPGSSTQAGIMWRSGVVAALFAWHPLRVESVAWITERKDVLSGFFFLLTLWAYGRYAQSVTSGQPSPGFGTAGKCQVTRTGEQNVSRVTFHVSGFYCLALLFFALGLMSKPMLVTLPFVLLLLDFWPLKRSAECEVQSADSNSPPQPTVGFQFSTLSRLFWEKWPFFALSAVFSTITYVIQKNYAAMVSVERLGLGHRISNAITSYGQYLVKLFWPAKLAVIYPYPRSYDTLEVWLTGLLLVAISAGCLCQLFRRPYLAMGWFWYLGTAVPIIGLVQVGEQAMADRYTYIPLIGPVISLVWLAAEWVGKNLFRECPTALAAIILPAACAISARQQVRLWENPITLFEHTVAVTTDNSFGGYCLAIELENNGRLSEAMVQYRIQEAIFPQDYRVHYSLAICLEKMGHWEQAVAEYNTVTAMGINPNDYIAHLNFADALSHLGRDREAVSQFNHALRIKPDSVEAMNNLAWLLATSPDANIRDGKRAVELAERACELTRYKQTMMVGTLAAAYAEAGRFDDAIATAEKACALASQPGQQDLLKKNRELLELYRKHQPYHEVRKP